MGHDHAAVGNIEVRLVTAERVFHPVAPQGILGHLARKFKAESFPYEPGALLIMHTDGISDRFPLAPPARAHEPQALAFQLGDGYGRGHDDQLLLVLKEVSA